MISCKLAALAIVSATLTIPAATAEQPDASSRRVEYVDLNLASPAGIATLRHRIAAAIETVCGGHEGIVTLSEKASIQRCRAKARIEADQRVAALLFASAEVASAR